ncbi:hypothetical protein ACG1BZ_12055 [Microbulbifer sp. CNSA002]|uniref:hypothetical protein n=1 Tax=unclassified Microbulbifer TaxID=2619833 RepID=UPI0039B47EAA
MPMPAIDDNESYTLNFDSKFSIQFIEHRGGYVLLSYGFGLVVEEHLRKQFLMEAMRKSYAWSGLNLSLISGEDGDFGIQSIMPNSVSFNVFFDITNYHCGFCDLLVKLIPIHQITKFEYREFITP